MAITDHGTLILSDDGNISFQLPCSQCRYDLRGLNPQSQCPECGFPIGESIEKHRLKNLPRPGQAGRAMTLALLGLVFPPLGIAALWVGTSAINLIDRYPDKYQGRGIAGVARVLGGIETFMTCGLVMLALLLPLLNTSRTPSRKMQNSTQLRGLHQQLVVFAQSNKNWFPGLTPTGVY